MFIKRFLLLIMILGSVGFCEALDQPDLTFVGTTPQVSGQADKIIIGLNVINVGLVSSNECHGSILVDGALNQTFVIPSLAKAQLPRDPAFPYEKHFDFTLASSPGSHTVEIRLDIDSRISEKNEGNNSKTRNVTVPASLTVTTKGSGNGNVNGKLSNGTAVITCAIQPPATCTQPVSLNSTVTLTATPASGSTFSWSNGSGSSATCTGKIPCTFIVTADSAIVARFDPPLSITVTKSGSGTVTDNLGMNCGADCLSTAVPGSLVSLRAVPATNSTFRNWSNGTGTAAFCNNSTSKLCTFTITQNSSIRATFD